MANNRKLYYFHIQHDRCELDEGCPSTYVNSDDEWRFIEEILKNLPIPDKMYNDSFIFKSGGPQVEEVVPTAQLILAFTLQHYLSDDQQKLLQAQIQMCTRVPPDERMVFLQQLMAHFATLPCFSNNDRVLLKLASRETKLIACESEALKERFESACHSRDACSLLNVAFQRNEFIARQIDLSLKSGETGVLFMGHLHNADNDMFNCLTRLQIPFEEKNECRASEGLNNLFGLSET